MNNRGTMVWFLETVRYIFLHLCMQTDCGAHPGSCPVGVVGSECVELCCHYTMFVNGMVHRNAMECVLRVNSLSATWENPPSSPTLWGTQTFITVFTPVLPLVHVVRQFNPGHAPSYFCNVDFKITIPFTARSSKWSLSYWLSHQNLLCPLFCPVVPY